MPTTSTQHLQGSYVTNNAAVMKAVTDTCRMTQGDSNKEKKAFRAQMTHIVLTQRLSNGYEPNILTLCITLAIHISVQAVHLGYYNKTQALSLTCNNSGENDKWYNLYLPHSGEGVLQFNWLNQNQLSMSTTISRAMLVVVQMPRETTRQWSTLRSAVNVLEPVLEGTADVSGDSFEDTDSDGGGNTESGD
ncbi:hypothetical protein FIBSPDRAFT_886205 [Athelia psychrophila]|uniref:Uncharacterized protein n=1 Tax=Athelia psychrophila TaxID=1759441 RepID=A0A166R7D9_9AGAM|nr:hypothetical protein FIBSPDRAFT_886205 [Fibularhizoctonia sp. CBS 109695]